jgi:tetratricopeptide (TPR) repeat protein
LNITKNDESPYSIYNCTHFLFRFRAGFDSDITVIINQSKEALKKSDVANALQFAHQALTLSTQKQNPKGIASANHQLAFIFESQSNYDSANHYLNQSLAISEKYQLKNELAAAHNLIGLVLWHQSEYKEALPHHAISLSLFQERKTKKD